MHTHCIAQVFSSYYYFIFYFFSSLLILLYGAAMVVAIADEMEGEPWFCLLRGLLVDMDDVDIVRR